MNKNEKLDQLFTEWQNFYTPYQERFIKDGIINEDIYDETTLKILLIAKEANDNTATLTDFRIHWNNVFNYRFDHRIAELVYGIQNNFPPFDDIGKNVTNYQKALKSMAFMDVKKSPVNSKCDDKELLENIKQNLHFIHREIEIINPDIIISCLVKRELVEAVFKEPGYQKTGYERCVFEWNGSKVIDFYHPSGQSVPAGMYSLMQNICRSEAFQNL
jgi:hypothetical protein